MNEELSPEVLGELHAELELARTQLRADIQALRTDERTQGREDTRESRAEEVGDSGDDGANLEQLERDHAQANVLRHRLAEVDHALDKFAQGAYGVCEVCGKPIPLARLRILPEARFDVQHQAEIDARITGPAH
jgi:DnaK suppressor protein